MAPPYPYSDITNWKAYNTAAWNSVFGAGSMLVQAGNISPWDAARASVAEAGSRLYNAAYNAIGPPNTNAQYYLNDILVNIWFYWPTTGTLKMSDILTAMLLAKFDELTSFIGIEDAYRSAIWAQPFNAEFYAALARGFMP